MIFMSAWQAEYIELVYGLAFVILASVCFSISKGAGKRLPWVWLGLFGVFHGLGSWAHCLTNSYSGLSFFPVVQAFLTALSFMCLAEFGWSGSYKIKGSGYGRWFLIPLLILAILSVVIKAGGMQEALLYVLGLAGGLLAARALLLASLGLETQAGRRLKAGGAAIGLYALFTGLPAFFVSEFVISKKLLNVFSFSHQAVRMFLILWLAAAVWSYSQEMFRKDSGEAFYTKRVKYALLAAALQIIALCLGWTATRHLEYEARNYLQQGSLIHLAALSNYIIDELDEADHAVAVIAGDDLAAAALLSGAAGDLKRVNQALDKYHEVLEAPVCYLVDAQGEVIASSNRNDPDSYVGHNYSFRPYFRQATTGEDGHYFALGVTSGKRGYYASSPVRDGQHNIIGAAVVKRKVESLEPAFKQHTLCFLVDPHGIVFMSSRPDMLYKSLWPLGEESQQALTSTNQFGGGPFQAVGLQDSADGKDIIFEGQHYILTSKILNSEGWSLVLLAPTADMQAALLPGLLITLFLSALTNFFFLAKQRSIEGTARISASEENYRSVFETTKAGTFIVEENNVITLVNREFERLSGYSKSKLEGKKRWTEFVAPEDLQRAEEYHRLRRTDPDSAPRNYEIQIIDRYGDVKYMLLTVDIIPGTKKSVVSAVDITERKKADEALKVSEDKYRTIFETTGAGTFIVEEDTTISLVNREFERLSGYSKAELEGKKSWTEFVAGEELEMMKEFHCRRRIDPDFAPRNYEFRFIDRHGIVKDVFLSVSIIPGTKMSVASLVDITERKLAVQALQEQSLFLQRLLDTIPNPIIYKDIHGLYQGCNKTYEEYTGLSKEEIVGKTAFDIYPGDLANKYNDMDLALFREPGVQVFEYYFIRADGARRDAIFNKATYLNTDGSVAGLIGVMVDITERKKADEALRLSEERFSKIFNVSPNIMSITTFTEGRFIVVNERFLKTHGYSLKEVIGRTADDIKIWVKPKRAEILRLLNEYGFISNLECVLRKKSGETLTGLYSAEIVCFNGEQHILSVANDITDHRRMEEEMARLERLNLIGEMAAGIGHEIRNPMTTVRGLLQLLGSKEDSYHYMEYYNLMIDELDRANSIITEFLSLAKNRTVSKKMLNLNSIVEVLFPLIQADAMRTDKFIQMEIGNIPDLLLDDKEIRQLILNLVRNGLEAMHPGGRITIKTFEEGENVVLAVRDEGKGIGQGDLEKLGTPFFTTKDSGTGLGLAVCYSIAARHEAAIEVKTGPGGTTFYIKFKLQNNTAVA